MLASFSNRFFPPPRERGRTLQSVAGLARGGLALAMALVLGCGDTTEIGADAGTSPPPDGGEGATDAAPGSDGSPPEADPTWSMIIPDGAAPTPRGSHAMAYDESRQRLVVFGGHFLPNAAAGDTWEWDGTSWEKLAPAVSPSPRQLHAMAYDAAREEVVLFGGLGDDFEGDTWVWDGNEWTDRTPEAGGPGPLLNHRMVYDAARSEVVLFGGLTIDFEAGGTERLDETWVWDGSSWTEKVGLPTSPPARSGFGMSYDEARERVVLFGGFRGGDSVAENYLYDTWEWDGSRWSRVSIEGDVPAAPSRVELAYDSALEVTILFGGQFTDQDEDGEYVVEVYDETWAFDGSSWEKLSPAQAPPANAGHELANDSDGHILLYGGRTGTVWTWK